MKNSIMILLSITILNADTTFQEWQQEQNRAFDNYQTQEDKEFIEMLKRDWQEYNAIDSINLYQKPKPQIQPILKPNNKIENIIHIPIKPLNITPINPIIPKLDMTGYSRTKFLFYGINIDIIYSQNIKYHINSLSILSIANFWSKISATNSSLLIGEIRSYQNHYNLDDWTTYLLVKKITQQITQIEIDQNLLSWFILTKLGIDTKVGFSQNSISVLVYINDKLYGINYFVLNGKKYYQFNPTNHRLKIYRGDMRGLEAMRFLNKQPTLPFDIKSKKIKFIYKNREYIFTIRYNRNLIKLYKKYPQLDYNLYKNISKISQKSITQELKPIISKMNQIEAINFLLRLTQNGFKYQTDQEQFYQEKVMFFEETLFYPYSDCEDRAIFFSMLIKELLNLDTLFIKYPNHLATAIPLNTQIGGAKFIYHNQNYYIADPTYSNANIGQVMPQFRGTKFKIIGN